MKTKVSSCIETIDPPKMNTLFGCNSIFSDFSASNMSCQILYLDRVFAIASLQSNEEI